MNQRTCPKVLSPFITYLDLESFGAAEWEIMHFDVRVVSITAALIFDKSKPDLSVHANIGFGCIGCAYNLLEGLRGAGISHRTRRP